MYIYTALARLPAPSARPLGPARRFHQLREGPLCWQRLVLVGRRLHVRGSLGPCWDQAGVPAFPLVVLRAPKLILIPGGWPGRKSSILGV